MSKLLLISFIFSLFLSQEFRRFPTPVERQEQRIRSIYNDNSVYKSRAMYFTSEDDAASGENGRLHSMQTFDREGRAIEQRVLMPDKKIRVITMTYDSLGNLETMDQKTAGKTDHQSKLYYDKYGELQLRIVTFPSGNVDSVKRTGNYWNGGVKFILESSIAKVAKTIQEYDSVNRQYKETFVSREGKIIEASRNTINDSGYIVKKEFRSNLQNRFDIYHFQYNSFGLVTEEKILNTQGAISSITNLEYDTKGLLQREIIRDDQGKVLRIIQYSYKCFDPSQTKIQ